MEPSDTKCASRDNNNSVHTISLQEWGDKEKDKYMYIPAMYVAFADFKQ